MDLGTEDWDDHVTRLPSIEESEDVGVETASSNILDHEQYRGAPTEGTVDRVTDR